MFIEIKNNLEKIIIDILKMEKIDKPISNIHKIANPPKMEPPEEHQEEIISTVKKEPISPENPKSILIKEYQSY